MLEQNTNGDEQGEQTGIRIIDEFLKNHPSLRRSKDFKIGHFRFAPADGYDLYKAASDVIKFKHEFSGLHTSFKINDEFVEIMENYSLDNIIEIRNIIIQLEEKYYKKYKNSTRQKDEDFLFDLSCDYDNELDEKIKGYNQSLNQSNSGKGGME